MPDPRPAGNGFEQMAQDTKAQRQRTRETEKPSGTMLSRLLETVTNRLAQIPGEVASAIEAQSMKRDDIIARDQAVLDATAPKVHQHDAADVATGTLARPVSTTTVAASASVTSAADLRGATLYATGAPAYNITGTRVAAWWQSADGRAGTASSSERYKTHIKAAELDPEAILGIAPVWYQYVEALEHAEWRRTCGPPYAEWDPTARAPLELGMIAERLHEAGLWPFVVYERDSWGRLKHGPDGEPIPDGIHYINWAVALQAVARSERDKRVALELRIDAIAAHFNLDI